MIVVYTVFAPLSLLWPEAIQCWLFDYIPAFYSAEKPYPMAANLLGLSAVAIIAHASNNGIAAGFIVLGAHGVVDSAASDDRRASSLLGRAAHRSGHRRPLDSPCTEVVAADASVALRRAAAPSSFRSRFLITRRARARGGGANVPDAFRHPCQRVKRVARRT